MATPTLDPSILEGLAREFHANSGYAKCTRVMLLLGRVISESEQAFTSLGSIADDINAHNRTAQYGRTLGYGAGFGGGVTATIGGIGLAIAALTAAPVTIPLVAALGGAASTTFGLATVVGTDTRLDALIRAKVENEVDPILERLHSSITELKQAWDIVGEMCTNIRVDLHLTDTTEILQYMWEWYLEASANMDWNQHEHLLKRVWSACTVNNVRSAIEILSIGITTVAALATGLSAGNLLHSINSLIQDEKHPTAQQITSQVLPGLRQQITDLSAAKEKLNQVLIERKRN